MRPTLRQSLLIMLAPAMVFFMATWEEYYTGTLALPIINGPNEGLAIMYSLYLATAIVGPAFWAQPNVFYPALNNNHMFILMTFVAAIGQCVVSGTCSCACLWSHTISSLMRSFVCPTV